MGTPESPRVLFFVSFFVFFVFFAFFVLFRGSCSVTMGCR